MEIIHFNRDAVDCAALNIQGNQLTGAVLKIQVQDVIAVLVLRDTGVRRLEVRVLIEELIALLFLPRIVNLAVFSVRVDVEHVIFFRHIDRELRILNQEAELEVAEILKFIVRVRPDRNLHRNLLTRLRYLVDRAVEAYAVSGEGIQDKAIRYRLAFILQREGNKPIVVRVRHIPVDADAVILLIDRLEGLNGKRLFRLAARLARRYGLALCLRFFPAAASNERKRKAQCKGPCHKFSHIFLLLSVCCFRVLRLTLFRRPVP